MRFKAAIFIVLSVFLFLVLGFFWQIRETQRTSADLIQLGKEEKIQSGSIETEDAILTVTNNIDQVSIGQQVEYIISYQVKNDLKQVRLVGSVGNTNKKVFPTFAYDLGNLKKGDSGSFTIPKTIQSGETDLAVSRITLSEMQKTNWWGKENRQILVTVDDIDKIIPVQ